MDASPNLPSVFISSTFKDAADDGPPLRLRTLIIEDARTTGIVCRTYELESPDALPESPAKSDAIIQECFRRIRDCTLFVFLETGRHGSGVRFLDDPVLSSYLELELFAAALWRKPILVLRLAGREPAPALRDAMALLYEAFGEHVTHVGSEDELRRRFVAACHALLAGRDPLGVDASSCLADGLSRCRSQATLRHDLEKPALLFLGGRTSLAGKRPDLDRARALLDQVTVGMPTEGHSVMPHSARVFRLWAAMRELMDDDGALPRDPEAAALWDVVLGRWSSSTSWMGVHGFVVLGPLAAVNSQIDLRRRFAHEKTFAPAGEVREPIGARASALYSVAQRLSDARRQVFHYREVEMLASQAMRQAGRDSAGAQTIRAMAALRLATLGRPWKYAQGLLDLRAALATREKQDASARQVGESKVALGYAIARGTGGRLGLPLMSEGVELMRCDASTSGQSFLAQGLRKLEDAERRRGNLDHAEALLRERHAIAGSAQAFDQDRPSE